MFVLTLYYGLEDRLIDFTLTPPETMVVGSLILLPLMMTLSIMCTFACNLPITSFDPLLSIKNWGTPSIVNVWLVALSLNTQIVCQSKDDCINCHMPLNSRPAKLKVKFMHDMHT